MNYNQISFQLHVSSMNYNQISCQLHVSSMNYNQISFQLHVSSMNYIWIVSTDLLISLLAVPVAISYLSRRAPLLFQYTPFCQAWGVLWNAAARMSVFMVAVLSITRTINLRYPFRCIKIRVIMLLMSGYAVVQLVQSTIPYWFHTIYTYQETHIQCQWLFEVTHSRIIIIQLAHKCH